MPIIAPSLTVDVIAWLAQNYDKIPSIAGKATDILQGLLQHNGRASRTIQRFGSNIVWNSPNGQRVIGVLDEVRTSLTGIETQQAITQASIQSLRGVAMVTLGLSGITVGLLVAQFAYLGKRLTAIEHELKKVQVKIDDSQEAKLKTALNFLQQAETATGDKRVYHLREALANASEAGHFFSAQATNPLIHDNDPKLIQFYARKYFLALSVVVSSLLGRDELPDLVNRIDFEDSTLRRLASLVYDSTLKDRLDELLSPELATIAPLHLTEHVYTQASELGCLTMEGGFDIRTMIDQEREAIFAHSGLRRLSPDFRSFKSAAAEKLSIAAGTFEEVQRLMSWRALGSSLVASGKAATELQEEVRQTKERLSTSDGEVLIYGVA
jgi:hypothetical protein